MIKVYENLRDENSNIVNGRTKLFIQEVNEGNEIIYSQSGTLLTPEDSGTMFIVDDWLIPQMDKLLFIDGELVVKDGETIEEPVKTEKEIKREELLKQIAELDAMEEHTKEEESTEEKALFYLKNGVVN